MVPQDNQHLPTPLTLPKTSHLPPTAAGTRENATRVSQDYWYCHHIPIIPVQFGEGFKTSMNPLIPCRLVARSPHCWNIIVDIRCALF